MQQKIDAGHLLAVPVTQLVGFFRDSGGNPIASGILRIKLDAPIVDISTSPDALYTPLETDFTITNGAIPTINLVESATQNTTYQFTLFNSSTAYQFYFLSGEQYTGLTHLYTDGIWYTGSVHSTDSARLDRVPSTILTEIDSFHAVVPSAVTVEFASLIPTRVSTDRLPLVVQQVAELLSTDSVLLQRIRGGPRWKGAFDPTIYYQKDDAVSYGGSSWIYINDNPAINQTPNDSNTAYWAKIAQKGDAGGTGGQDTAYSSSGWDGQTWAPTANAIRDKIETLATIASLSAYAPLASPNFTGSPNRSTSPTFGDRSTQIPTTAWVGNEFATINNAALTGNPTAPTPPQGTYNTQIATLAWVQTFVSSPAFVAYKTSDQTLSTGNSTIVSFSSKPLDTNSAFNLSTGTFTVPTGGDGWYEFYATARFSRSGGTQFDFVSLSIFVAGANDYRVGEIQATAMTSIVLGGAIRIYMSAGQTAILRVANLQGTGTITCQNNFSNSFFTHFSGRKLPY